VDASLRAANPRISPRRADVFDNHLAALGLSGQHLSCSLDPKLLAEPLRNGRLAVLGDSNDFFLRVVRVF
jgi:hypothetical protein